MVKDFKTKNYLGGNTMYRISLFFFLIVLFPYSLNAITPKVQKTGGCIELRNDFVSILISENAELISFLDLNNNIDIANNKSKKIAYLTTEDGDIIEANKVILDGNTLFLSLGSFIVELEVIPYDHYFTLEVKSEHLLNIVSFTFFDIKLNYNFNEKDVFLAVGIALNLKTNQLFYPSGESKEILGRCYSLTGLRGAKIAIIACKKAILRNVLKEVYSTVKPGELPLTTTGGPFALESDELKMDRAIVKEAVPSKISSYIDDFSQFGIRQFEFSFNTKAFVQGQFSFPTLGSAAEFKRLISTPLLKSGIYPVLHTYSFYIGYDAFDLLSNPRWQKQLEFRESYNLSEALSPTNTEIPILNENGALVALINDPNFKKSHSPFIIIDNELIKYYADDDGHIMVQRGQCGTKAVSHKAGSLVRIIGGYFSHIAPQPGSELFYEVARRTAKAYNEGGFKGVYFDALDGLSVHLEYAGLRDYLWFYGATFVNEFIKNCNESPIVEYSTMYPSLWLARGRGGTWDMPYRGYKFFIKEHIRINKPIINRNYITTLGWFNFYPMQSKEPWNYLTKYLYSDDVDYVGAQSIAYGQPMVYHALSATDIQSTPALKRNMVRYSLYSELNRKKYFSDDVLSILRNGKYEYKLVRKGLRWSFKEAVYLSCKMRDVNQDQLQAVNPFRKQKPFIRLLNLYSSDSDNGLILLSFDEGEDFNNQKREILFSNSIDISNYLGIKIKVKGNNSDDALCVRLTSSTEDGVADYIVRLNFEGWRDIVLTDVDNGEDQDYVFDGRDNTLDRIHRYKVDYKNIESIHIYKSGECKGVRIGKVEAVPIMNNPLINPCVHLEASNIIFLDTIDSGEYIEYYVGNKTAIVYNHIGESRVIDVYKKGRFKVPSGSFSTIVTGESSNANAPIEVLLTLGLYGKYINN